VRGTDAGPAGVSARRWWIARVTPGPAVHPDDDEGFILAKIVTASTSDGFTRRYAGRIDASL
jgi:hypothetical protein